MLLSPNETHKQQQMLGTDCCILNSVLAFVGAGLSREEEKTGIIPFNVVL